MYFKSLEKALQNPDQVTRLRLENASVVDKAILQFKNLEYLEFWGDKESCLQELPDEIGLLKKLKWLMLPLNKIKTLPASLTQLSNLEGLSLLGNKFTGLPDFLSKLPNLKELNLRHNPLTALPKVLLDMPQLKLLELGNTQLKALPSEMSKLAQLEELVIEWNNIEDIPHLPGLKILKWGSIESVDFFLTELPPGIGKLTNLEVLNLYGNRISQLNDELGQLQKLKTLHLGSNSLDHFPEIIATLSGLQHLDLSRNRISHLPIDIGQLKNLEVLSLDNNFISQLPEEALLQLGQLKHLAITNNEIKDKKLRRLPAILKGTVQMPYETRYFMYQLALEYRTDFNAEEIPLLWEALCFPVALVRIKALGFLQTLIGSKAALAPTDNVELVLLGKFKFKVKEVSQQMTALGWKVSKKLRPSTTHVVIGEKPKLTWNELKAYKVQYCFEEDIRHYLQNNTDLYLLNPNSTDYTKQLHELLLSNDGANVRLALEMMQNGGVPTALMTDLYMVAHLDEEENRKLARLLFTQNADNLTLQLISQTYAFKKGDIVTLEGYLKDIEAKYPALSPDVIKKFIKAKREIDLYEY